MFNHNARVCIPELVVTLLTTMHSYNVCIYANIIMLHYTNVIILLYGNVIILH